MARQQTGDKEKPILQALKGRMCPRPPFWLMRQAGRYLPEYAETRAKAGSFLDLVFNPALAAEVTVQPLRRFGMDAAILFSDILVIPLALGRQVKFEDGEGPKLEPLATVPVLLQNHFDQTVRPVFETVKATRELMKKEGFDETALIGFAGSPWTIACYMVEGGGSRDFALTRRWAWRDPDRFGQVIDVIVKATIAYIEGQINAGAEIIQLFDSWAGVLDETQFRRWVITPTRKIVDAIKRDYPHVPIIGFPRGAGISMQAYSRDSGITAISLDHTVPLRWAAAALQPSLPIQGNLDPMCLLAGGDVLDIAMEHIYSHLSLGPFVFNLGHGIHKETPVAHVAHLAERARDWKG